MDAKTRGLSRVPKHVAIIMDGNGRWASARGLQRGEGHRRGADRVREIVEAAAQAGVRHLTLFAFSTENWKRPLREIAAIFGLVEEFLRKETKSMAEKGIAVGSIGGLERLPEGLLQALAEARRATKDNQRLEVVLALNYGARREIAMAAAKLASDATEGKLDPACIDEDELAHRLSTPLRPDPDLIIRTGGEFRLSNFLLWQAAYAELHFSESAWPDFTASEFRGALAEFARRQRRYGAVDKRTGGFSGDLAIEAI